MKKTDLYELSYEMKRQMNGRIISVILFFVLLCSVVSLILNFVIFPVRQRSVSMEPNVSSGSCVMISHLNSKKKRGEIVLVASISKDEISFARRIIDSAAAFFTGQQYFPLSKRQKSGTTPFLRRIVGLPGDTIYMKDYVLYIRPAGQQYFLTEFEFIKKAYNISITPADSDWDKTLGAVGTFDEITLGENDYFLLSDNRTTSADCRLWGAVSGDKIIGKAVAQYFPFKAFRFY